MCSAGALTLTVLHLLIITTAAETWGEDFGILVPQFFSSMIKKEKEEEFFFSFLAFRELTKFKATLDVNGNKGKNLQL